jgi:hypothetical protein
MSLPNCKPSKVQTSKVCEAELTELHSIDGSNVTAHSLHDECGHRVADISVPSPYQLTDGHFTPGKEPSLIQIYAHAKTSHVLMISVNLRDLPVDNLRTSSVSCCGHSESGCVRHYVVERSYNSKIKCKTYMTCNRKNFSFGNWRLVVCHFYLDLSGSVIMQ